MKKLLNIILCIALPIMANAQELGQTLKGKVTDQATREPLIGATIVVEGADPAVSATTDESAMPALVYADLTVNYRINHLKSSSVFSFQMKNVLGSPIYIEHNYNYKTKQIQLSKATFIIPNISYRIEF